MRGLRSSIRYRIMELRYFTDEKIAESCSKRLTKKLTHVAIAINNYQNTRQEILKVSEIIAWTILTGCSCVTIFEQSGRLVEDKQMIENIVKRQIEKAYTKEKAKVEVSSPQGNEDHISSISFTMMKKDKQVLKEATISYLKNYSNMKELLASATNLPRQNYTKDNGKLDFESLEREVQNQLQSYKHTLDLKNVSRNPELVLVFNSPRRVLQFKGFPILMKEIAEILECGTLSQYGVVNYVQSIEKYSQIEQRWGL